MSCFVDIVRPKNHHFSLPFDIFSVFAGSWFLALCAQVSIPLGFTPVPLSLQTFGVLLIGAFLGSKRGFSALIAYIMQGALGLPVFAAGKAGLTFGPSFGYLLGFVAAAFLVGFLLERGWKDHIGKTFLALFLGSSVILSSGAFYLAMFVGLNNAFFLGVTPFLIGDFLKLTSATCLIRAGWRVHGWFQQEKF